ncbi:MAG: flagellar hook-length control protein FliK [Gammaproteobacteria bacterium]
MSTSLPLLVPGPAGGGGESTALPVNTAVGDSSQAFANVLSSHFQPETAPINLVADPLAGLPGSALLPLLSMTPADGAPVPLDLSQADADGKLLPLSPELMWSGMLIVNNSDDAGPKLYQLSDDGKTLSAQVDPNLRVQLNRAMNRFAPLASADMPDMMFLAEQVPGQKTPGMNEQSLFFAATASTQGAEALASAKLNPAQPGALLTGGAEALAALAEAEGGPGQHNIAMHTATDRGLDRLPELVQLQMTGSPKNPAWAQGIGERVQWLIQQNLQGAEIRLNPPELGLLEVKLRLNAEQGTQIQFSSPNGSVREALEAAIPRLREMFAENGLSLGDVNVSHQSLAEQQNGNTEGGEEGHASTGLERGAAQPEAEERGVKRLVSEGLVDMYV